MKGAGRMRLYREGFAFRAMLWTGRIPSHAFRNAVYRHALGVRLAPTAYIYGGAEIRNGSAISIGEHTIVGHDAILDGRRGLTIGARVNLSSEVAIWTEQHDLRARDFGVTGGPVSVGDYAWLSFRATILPGVTIGEGAVVAAGAVVTHDVEPYTVVAGVPAQPVGQRPRDLDYSQGQPPPFT
jgi:acetyltransferase-like isoleucine patch superfamily enzyme